MKRLLALICLLALMLPLVGCMTTVPPSSSSLDIPTDGKTLTVSFLDVGQGDSIFIELPDGKTMLIDASESDQADTIEAYIRARGHQKLDYLVATHPHADHIGGMRAIVEAFEIGEVWMPNADATTATYEKLLTAIDEKGLSIHTAKAGKVILETESLRIDLLAPCKEDYSDLNDYSAVIKLTYGSTKFLFTGDAETLSEEEMIASGTDLSADVLKLGHHGSSTSSSEAFLKAVSPTYGIISCGEGNDYGHPHSETLESAAKHGITLYRTDLLGHIVFTSDGSTVKTASAGELPEAPDNSDSADSDSNGYKWVLNTSSKKIHRPDCASAASMSEANKAYSSESIAALTEQGYTACGSCDPAD